MAAAYLFQGLVLGFAAGISLGPVLGLVIGQTLRREDERDRQGYTPA